MNTQSFTIVLLAFVLATSSRFAVAQEQASSVDTLTQREAKARVQGVTTSKQVKALIVSAKTPEDHLKLAAYFNQEADRLEADAKDHAELADLYRQHPHTTGRGKQSGAGSIFQTADIATPPQNRRARRPRSCEISPSSTSKWRRVS